MQTNTMTLPPVIESQLVSLELRHARHQRLMEDQRLRKVLARERHAQGKHRHKHAPNTLI